MISRNMLYHEFSKGIFEIDEFDCSSIFVVVGQERALIIDTGVGIGDLKGLIEEKITDLPYSVVATHKHGDHLGGAAWFPEVYIHPQDMDIFSTELGPNFEFRKDYAAFIREQNGKTYNYKPETDIRPWPREPEFYPLADEQVFDLGGRKVTAFHCPGHTAGSMIFFDDLSATLICGDAFNNNYLLDSTLAPSLRQCAEITLHAMEKVWAKKDLMTVCINSHHDFRTFGEALGTEVIPDLIILLEQILEGAAAWQRIQDPFNPHAMKHIAHYRKVQISCLDTDLKLIYSE